LNHRPTWLSLITSATGKIIIQPANYYSAKIPVTG